MTNWSLFVVAVVVDDQDSREVNLCYALAAALNLIAVRSGRRRFGSLRD